MRFESGKGVEGSDETENGMKEKPVETVVLCHNPPKFDDRDSIKWTAGLDVFRLGRESWPENTYVAKDAT